MILDLFSADAPPPPAPGSANGTPPNIGSSGAPGKDGCVVLAFPDN
ncbi:hypothetical protein P3T37_000905 [Kitasatospora sp. MAA4]|nr:hypothetical protein [Kitasatospora sp. MAA4]MDH6131536.1 hypothetical protein [Kitasatospora sp. MAA4]